MAKEKAAKEKDVFQGMFILAPRVKYEKNKICSLFIFF
jgi:hypothetical protein